MSVRFRLLYRVITVAALAGAAVGVALPLIPTAPFLLIAAWSASRHSPELEARLLANPRVGPHILAWRQERALSRRAKRGALIGIGLSFTISLLTVDSYLVLGLVAAILLGVAVFLVTRPEPGSRVAHDRGP